MDKATNRVSRSFPTPKNTAVSAWMARIHSINMTPIAVRVLTFAFNAEHAIAGGVMRFFAKPNTHTMFRRLTAPRSTMTNCVLLLGHSATIKTPVLA